MKPKMPWQRFYHGRPTRLRESWKKLFSSTHKRMTRGSSNISKIISWARNENWRRKEPKK